MKTLTEVLFEYMKLNSVPDDIAWAAAQNCAQSTALQTAAGGFAGAASGAGLMAIGAITPPTEAAALSWTIIAGAAGAVGGSYHALTTSPSCHEVRAAASYLAGSGN
jgi:hypothetical protein